MSCDWLKYLKKVGISGRLSYKSTIVRKLEDLGFNLKIRQHHNIFWEFASFEHLHVCKFFEAS